MGVERGQKVTLSGAKCTSEEVLGRPLAARGQREMGQEALEPQTWARRAGPGGRQWGPSRGSPEGLGTPPTPHWSRRSCPRLAGPSGLLGLTLTLGAGFTHESCAGPVCVCAAALVMSVPAQQREVAEQAAPSRLAAPSATPRASRKSRLPRLALSPEGSVDGRMDVAARTRRGWGAEPGAPSSALLLGGDVLPAAHSEKHRRQHRSEQRRSHAAGQAPLREAAPSRPPLRRPFC